MHLIKRLEKVIREQWDEPALTDYGSDVTFRYRDVAYRICYLHLLFESLDIKPGDKIAVCDRNSCNWAISMLAVLTYRAVAVPLLPDYSKEQLRMLCEHCDAKFMIAHHRLANLWPEGKCPMYMIDMEDLLAMTPTTLTDEVEDKAYALFAKRYPGGFTKEHVHYEAENPDDLMILSYTSGSTGNPKGVMLPWRSLQSNLQFAADALPCEKGLRAFLILPMAHMFGFAFDFLYCITCGAHLFILTKIPAPKVILEAFATIRPDYFLCVPLVMEKIIKSKVMPVLNKPLVKVLFKIPGIHELICRKIRRQLTNSLGGNFYEVIMGGAALSKEVEKILRMVGFRFTVGYGMTECAPLICFAPHYEFVPGSCGRILPLMEGRITSPNSAGIGEIEVRGENVMTGYYKNEEATRDVFTEDGWLRTGDLGILDENGNLFIKGRSKTMLLGPSGQNIYPEEIEDVLNNMPFVLESLVMQNTDNALVALVCPDMEAVDKAHLSNAQIREQMEVNRKQVNTQVAAYEQITQIRIFPHEFEKTPKKSIKRFLYNASMGE